MGGGKDGEGINVTISHEDLEFLLGGLSVLRTDLQNLADTKEKEANLHRASAEKAEELERRLLSLL